MRWGEFNATLGSSNRPSSFGTPRAPFPPGGSLVLASAQKGQIEAARKKIVESALSMEGDINYSFEAKNGSFHAESWKCNLFVLDVLKKAGIDPPLLDDGPWPMYANGWANPDHKIPGWVIVDTPMPGDVAAIPRADTGHVGIYIGERWGSDVMAANAGGVGWSKSHLFNEYFHSLANSTGDTVYRRYVGN